MIKIPTREKLALALEEAKAPLFMIKRAREGIYDDFMSPLPMPISQLVIDATGAGLRGIADKARNGDFDATKEEADDWYKKEGKDLLIKK